jgi:hypothetical protein
MVAAAFFASKWMGAQQEGIGIRKRMVGGIGFRKYFSRFILIIPPKISSFVTLLLWFLD